MFPRTQVDEYDIKFKSFVRIDTRFNLIKKLKKNDVVMINSIHGKFAKVVSLPNENALVNQRDWLGFLFQKSKKFRNLNPMS